MFCNIRFPIASVILKTPAECIQGGLLNTQLWFAKHLLVFRITAEQLFLRMLCRREIYIPTQIALYCAHS
jgi:hypothetical protein